MKIITLSLLLLATSPCYSQVFEKNGNACIAEICLGDGIKEFSAIPWSKVDFKRSRVDFNSKEAVNNLYEDYKLKLKGTFPPKAAVYLYTNSVDSEGVKAIQGVTAVCEGTASVAGTFVSKGGNLTKVGLTLMAINPQSAEQRWTVSYITRLMELPKEQGEEAVKQLKERYAKFYLPSGSSYKATEKNIVSIQDGYSAGSFQVRLDLEYAQSYKSQLSKAPYPSLCSKKLNID